MKKIVLSISLIILSVSAIYFFIPAQLIVSTTVKLPVNIEGLFRSMSKETNWNFWWPGKVSSDRNGAEKFINGSFVFGIKKIMYRSFEIEIIKDGIANNSQIQLISTGSESVIINWATIIQSTNNPFTKISRYLKASDLRNKKNEILNSLLAYVTPTLNLYGIDVKKETVGLEYMVTTSKVFDHYPSTKDIYALVDEISNYIVIKRGYEDSAPMLNIISTNSINYKAQVAIGIKQRIEGNDSFAIKTMFKGGNILTAKIKGGNKNILNGMNGFDQYISDYEKTMMAMPFQMLTTNRRKETDSTKWITVLHYPVQ